jgi:four helix bundle protein
MYRLTSEFPESERFGLTSQLKRGAVSIASNIVEGSLRSSEREYLRFLEIAYGSAGEVTYQLSVADRVGLATNPVLLALALQLANDTTRALGALVRYLGSEGAPDPARSPGSRV